MAVGRWPRRLVRSWVVAAVVLVIGVADQSIDIAVPDYDEVVGDASRPTGAFFGDLQDELPNGAMVFQLPFREFPGVGDHQRHPGE